MGVVLPTISSLAHPSDNLICTTSRPSRHQNTAKARLPSTVQPHFDSPNHLTTTAQASQKPICICTQDKCVQPHKPLPRIPIASYREVCNSSSRSSHYHHIKTNQQTRDDQRGSQRAAKAPRRAKEKRRESKEEYPDRRRCQAKHPIMTQTLKICSAIDHPLQSTSTMNERKRSCEHLLYPDNNETADPSKSPARLLNCRSGLERPAN